MVSTFSERMVGALAKLSGYAGTEATRRNRRPPVSIALSRQAGSRGADVARQAGAKLGWPVYDQELLQSIAREKGLQARLLEQMDERHMSWMEEMAMFICAGEGGRESQYLHSLQSLFAKLSEVGHCIIVGRGAPHVLPVETTLRVRILAPRADRIAQVERSRRLPRAEAEKWVNRTDHERKRFIEYYFRKDPEDPQNYDLMLNSGRVGVASCAEVIVRSVRAMELGNDRGDRLANGSF